MKPDWKWGTSEGNRKLNRLLAGNLRFGKSWNGWKKLKHCRCVFAQIVSRTRTIKRRHRCSGGQRSDVNFLMARP